MSSERRGVEVLVGLFLLIGFVVVAVMVVMFGSVGKGLQKTYSLTVEFPNASGLIKDAYVLMAGARIGYVSDPPKLITMEGEDGRVRLGVSVGLTINEGVQIPEQSDIVVGQSGLLGDCYVDVIPHRNADLAKAIEPGSTVRGSRATGLDELQKKGGEVLDSLLEEIEKLKETTTNLNQNVLSKENVGNMSKTLENLREMSSNWNDASSRLDGIFSKADRAVASAEGTFKTAQEAAEELKATIGDVRKDVNRIADSANTTMKDASAALKSLQVLVKKAEQGDGTLGVLLSDPQTAENLKRFIFNLRRSGVLWYKDRPIPEATPIPRRRR